MLVGFEFLQMAFFSVTVKVNWVIFGQKKTSLTLEKHQRGVYIRA